uniref:carboxymuconolactone decarboxylase family protein n=1 Tax=Castellaniella defragrans TaxID=75697 RepID=UPI00333EB43F
MTTSYKQLTQDIQGNLAQLYKSQPDTMNGFAGMSKAAYANGALDAKTKELIALAVGVAVRCDGCIGFHTKALARLGATEQEVHEALGVAIQMGGGPSAMYAANAVAAYNEFASTTQA